MFGWLWTILIGFVAGSIAKMLMKNFQGGFLLTVCLGIGGSIVMSFLGRMTGWYGEGGGASFVASTLGAILILWVYGKFIAKKA